MELQSGSILRDLQRWVASYMQEVTNKNLADRTIIIYSSVLEAFVEYARQFQGEIDLADINRIFLNGYLAEMDTAKKVSASTKKLHITVLKAFFGYITENNDSNSDFTNMFKKMIVKTEIKEKVGLTNDEVTKLLKYLEYQKKTPRNKLISYRNSLLIKTMLYGGLRAHELLELRIKDFVLNPEYEVYVLLVKGKGGKERYVYVPYSTAADEVETLAAAKGNSWLICSTRSAGLINLTNLYQIVSATYKRASIDKTGLHILRHTMARRHVTAGTNLETIRDLLGHSSISITSSYYAKTNEANKMVAVLRCSKPTD